MYIYTCVWPLLMPVGRQKLFAHTSADYSNILSKIQIHTCTTAASALISTLLGEPLITAGFSSVPPAHCVEIGEGEKKEIALFCCSPQKQQSDNFLQLL